MKRRYDETSMDLDSNYLVPVLAVPEGANKIVMSRLVSRVRGQQARDSEGFLCLSASELLVYGAWSSP